MPDETFTISARFNGPPGSGNGGYVCGRLALYIDGPAEVSLRAPPPLDAPLHVRREDGRVSLYHGATLVAEARPAPGFALAAPAAPSLAEAKAAAPLYVGLLAHRYPTCFVCGDRRAARDGLDIFTGAVGRDALVASPWTPTPDLAGADGRLAPEFLHAALDCPTYWALPRAGEMAALLARLTASIDAASPPIGETLIVAAWPLGSDGRKHRGASAVYGADGRVLARAEALWIEPKAD